METGSSQPPTSGSSRRRCLYQIGAPALIYREKIDEQSSYLQVPGHRYPLHDTRRVAELEQRRNRLATRWYYSAGEIPPLKKHRKRKNGRRSTKNSPAEEYDLNFGMPCEEGIQQNRAAIFDYMDTHHNSEVRDILQAYAQHDRPYIKANLVKNRKRNNTREPKIEIKNRENTRNFKLQRQDLADPAYLAPFGFDAINEDGPPRTFRNNVTVDTKKTDNFGPRPWQGNCLLCIACPCPNCRVEPSWCLFHPKGLLMDTLCVSNLLFPNGHTNAGHLLSMPEWLRKEHTIHSISTAQAYLPNAICLDDTIVEVQKSGLWDADHLECDFVVRTASYVSVVQVRVSKPDLSQYEVRNPVNFNDLDESLCWGCYVLKEKFRLDLRSLLSGTPSYRPVSLACHPKYGNDFTSALFAFSSYSEHSGDQNVIHRFAVEGPEEKPIAHPIAALRSISTIDFSSIHPMCLWCSASSYVRPPLVSDIQYSKQYPLGFGSALYSVDLRTNMSVYHWSPSAEEMKPEGFYSINGLLTDWDHNHTVWVTSRSAGKTGEIDCRMPYEAVNSWSLSTVCDDETVSFSQSGPYGDPFLLSKVHAYTDGNMCSDANMIVNVDTSPETFGFRFLQRPLHKPRFQTDSLECISVPGLESQGQHPSLATTSLFALPARSDDVFTCGIAGFRTSLRNFLDGGRSAQEPFHNEDSTVLCTLSMNNKGDIYCYSLLEADQDVPQCQSFPGLPTGTAAIPLSEGIDGKTLEVEHKRWKPTDGMNLKIFWSNLYPTPRDNLLYVKPTASPQLPRFRMIKKEKHPSYRKGKDEEPFEIHSTGKTNEYRIAAAPGSSLVNTENKPLVLPKSLAEKSINSQPRFRPIDPKPPPTSEKEPKNGNGNDNEDDDKAEDEDEGKEDQPVTDLTFDLIERATKKWELWDELEDNFSSDDDKK